MGRLLGIAIWIITLASIWMFASKRWWFPEAISEHGPSVDRQFMLTIIVVGVAFAAAQIGLGWVVWKYRDNASKQRAIYSHGNNRLEVLWTVVTAVIFISLAIMGQRVWASLNLHAAPAGSYQIEVVAQQFAWNIHYPGKDNVFGRTDPTLIDDTSNPVGLDDADPNSKDDTVVPTLVIATKTGKFELACAELCGMNHFKMKSFMLVLPQNDFDALTKLSQAQFQDRKNQLLDSYQLPQY